MTLKSLVQHYITWENHCGLCQGSYSPSELSILKFMNEISSQCDRERYLINT